MADLIALQDIATELKLEITTVRRLLAREAENLNITIHRGKSDKVFLDRADADKLIAYHQARRGPIAPNSTESSAYDRYGYFYLIQLIPEIMPNRVKIGFADNVEKRLTEHKTAAPTAKLIKSWPCKRSWDYAVMDSITRADCKLVLNEVYEGEIEAFVKRTDDFFALMPKPDNEKPLSEHSPLFSSEDDET